MTSDMHTSLLELEGFDLSAPPTNHLHLPLHLHGKDGLNYVVILEIIIIKKILTIDFSLQVFITVDSSFIFIIIIIIIIL
jgi:hypothetical protein